MIKKIIQVLVNPNGHRSRFSCLVFVGSDFFFIIIFERIIFLPRDTETREAIQCFVDVDLKKPLSFKEVNVVLEINGFELPHNTILRIFRKVRRAMVGIGCVSRDGCITNQITESISPEQAAIRRKKFKASLSSFRNCSGRTWSADAMESLKCFYDVDPKRTPSMQDILVVLDSFGFKFDRPANFRIYNKIKAAMKYLRKSA